MTSLRIVIETPVDYPWPFVAVLQERDEGGHGWYELDAEGGDTKAEAVETLKRGNRQARGVDQ